MKKRDWPGPLFTDLYELTMSAAYFKENIFSDATFSLYIRNDHPHRNYFVAAGLEYALNALENYSFTKTDIDYLESTKLFSKDFLSFLSDFRFSGTVFAMPEGTVFFENEPLLEITAPIIEAQLLETFLLNTISFSTLIASKAARNIYAAQGRPLIDFSMRRAQGIDAGIKVARSTYIAGFAGTSNVLAGKVFGMPVSGTMAHSYVTAFNSEHEAFSAYSKIFPETSVFLIDTYDTINGARIAARVGKEMEKRGDRLFGVRLDSGDMTALSIEVRKILDESGLSCVKIVASGNFDEYKIADAISKGAFIDTFGVGTKVGVSADAPFQDIVYKMVRFGNRDIKKLSSKKITLAGKKQVFRKTDNNGRYVEDLICLRNEKIKNAYPILDKVMGNGKLLRPNPDLNKIRERFSTNFSLLDEKYKSINEDILYPVKLSSNLNELQKKWQKNH